MEGSFGWTIRPGMTRHDVRQNLGPPRGDGAYGRCRDLLVSLPEIPLEQGSVWHYGDVVVIFRDQRVVQVVGNLHGAAGGAQELVTRKWARRYCPFPSLGWLVRDRLRQRLDLGLMRLTSSAALDYDVELPQGKVAPEVLDPGPRGQGAWKPVGHPLPSPSRWKPVVLRRALWECLHFGPHYLMAAGQVARFPERRGILISSRSRQAGPEVQRCALLAETARNRNRMSGLVPPPLVVLDEIPEEECWDALQRLLLAGNCDRDGVWTGGSGSVRLVDCGEPAPSLRLAAGLARLSDLRRNPWPIMFPGPAEGIYEMSVALSGHQEGKPSWDRVGSAVPDLCLDWTDPAVRFHVLGTPIRATLKRLEQDRLTPLLDLLRALRQVDPPDPERWSPGWCAELPRDEVERDLLRHIEHFPHDSPGKVSKYVSTLRSMEELARPWLETCDSPAQRLLAVGVANVLALGLEILGIEGYRTSWPNRQNDGRGESL